MSTVTLAYNGTTLNLPSALAWTDELSWSPVVQRQTYSTTGALLYEHAVKQTGRPYTLEGAEDRAWCTRELTLQLKTWAAIPSIQMTLVIRGTSRNVTFDHVRGALEGFPLVFYEDGSIANDDFYVPTIRLIEV
jgi:hypothetical protein